MMYEQVLEENNDGKQNTPKKYASVLLNPDKWG